MNLILMNIMVEDLRISMIQSHIIWGDREENLAYYGELIRRVQGRSDLAILPETFTTGFACASRGRRP